MHSELISNIVSSRICKDTEVTESFAPQWVHHTQNKVVQTAAQVGARHTTHTGGHQNGHSNLPATPRRFFGWCPGRANRTRLIRQCARAESCGGVDWRIVVAAPDQRRHGRGHTIASHEGVFPLRKRRAAGRRVAATGVAPDTGHNGCGRRQPIRSSTAPGNFARGLDQQNDLAKVAPR